MPDLPRLRDSQPTLRSTYAQLHQRLLERYAPPSVVVDENYELLHISESAGQFMQRKDRALVYAAWADNVGRILIVWCDFGRDATEAEEPTNC